VGLWRFARPCRTASRPLNAVKRQVILRTATTPANRTSNSALPICTPLAKPNELASTSARVEILDTFGIAKGGKEYRRLVAAFERIFGATIFFGTESMTSAARVVHREPFGMLPPSCMSWATASCHASQRFFNDLASRSANWSVPDLLSGDQTTIEGLSDRLADECPLDRANLNQVKNRP
jgi:hypothetical protein